MQVDDGIVLPDKASLHLTAIEDADYKEDKIECEFIYMWYFYKLVYLISLSSVTSPSAFTFSMTIAHYCNYSMFVVTRIKIVVVAGIAASCQNATKRVVRSGCDNT